MKLSSRLMLAMVALVAMTAAAVGFLAYRSIETALLPRALGPLELHARLQALQLEASVGGARTDAATYPSSAPLEGLVAASLSGEAKLHAGVPLAEWRVRLAGMLAAQLAAKPSYAQLRLIGAGDGGREIVRVDRSGPGGAIRTVPEQELQSAGRDAHLLRALELPAGAVDVRLVGLRPETLDVPQLPAVRVVTPIHAPDGQPFGVLVIDVGLRAAFAELRAAASEMRYRLYVTDTQGSYLLHPDTAEAIGAQPAGAARIQDEFPEVAAMLSTARVRPRVLHDAGGSRFGAAMASARLADGPGILVVEMVPYSQVFASTVVVRNSALLAGILAMLAAVAVAAFTTRSLTRPLERMIDAVQAFREGKPMRAPTEATGEIGVLARAFERMAADMRAKKEALARETELRRRIFETSLDLIVVVDRRGTLLEVSPSSTAIVGYAPEQMIGRSAREFLHPDDLESTRREMRLARRGQEMRNFETRYVHRNGQPVALAWTGVWSEPEQRHFFIGRDMTERRLEEQKFRLAVEACPTGMLMTDGAGRIVMVNTEIERLFGYRRDELVGSCVDMLVPHRMRAGHARRRAMYAASGAHHRMGVGGKLVGERKDGTEFPLEVTLTSIDTRDGGQLTLGVVLDVTERKRAERLKDEFVSTVSHELRTPLTSIAGSLGLLAGGAAGELSDAANRLLTIAYSNSRRLVRLINDILDIEKLELGKVPFDLRRVDIKALAAQAIEANGAFSDSFRVRVRLDACEEEAYARADPDRLTQVLINFLSNAAKFSPPHEEVLVSVTVRGNRVRIAVRDHGPGIPHEFKDRIFEKFAQSETGRRHGGTGLGLSIARQIVQQLGGTVGFEAAPGGGTVFYAEVPHWDPLTMSEAAPEPEALQRSA